jgi:hypothetical protein
VTLYVLSEETLNGTGMCLQAYSRKSLEWLSHERCHTRITWPPAEKLLLHIFEKSSEVHTASVVVFLAL